ncbi:MAG: hypothetical protein HUJ97_04490 [Bacteroidales bacterium]|nr:hypothetical protein [Bacteroidales bacterium]
MKKLFFMCVAALSLTACTGNKQTKTEEPKTKSLVVYYSQTSTTEQVAKIIASSVGADIEAIVPEVPYDGDFGATIARCQEEMGKGEYPKLKALEHNLADYDTIYVGCPVWFGIAALPMTSWLKSTDLSGKIIVPFVSFGSGGLETTTNAMKELAPKSTFIEGYGVRTARISKAAAEIEEFLVRRGIKTGSVEEEKPFGEERTLSDEDKTIFDQACGTYSMPLGTPVAVSERDAKDGKEYRYKVESQDAQGNKAQALIFVITSTQEEVTPEFTRVVR